MYILSPKVVQKCQFFKPHSGHATAHNGKCLRYRLTGSYPSVPKGTKGIVNLEANSFDRGLRGVSPEPLLGANAKARHDWTATYLRSAGSNHKPRFEARVSIPVSAPVGLWRLRIETRYGDKWSEPKNVFKTQDPFYVLFNPYDEDDPVFLPHQAGLEEYVYNETGKLYGGSHNKVQGRPWVFGQLRDSVLPAVCHLLDNKATGLWDSERGDPIKVTRAISAVVGTHFVL